MFVTGEPGIGKTSLVTPLPRAISTRGARVLLGTCDDLSIPRPLGPIRDLAGERLAGARRRALRRRRAARHPDAADRGARAPRRGRRCSCSRTCTGRTTRRSTRSPCSAGGSARFRRCSCSPSAAARRRRVTGCTRPSARSAPTTRWSSSSRRCRRARSRRSPATSADEVYAATGGNPFYVTELLGLADRRRAAAVGRQRRARPRLAARRRRAAPGRARLGRAEPRASTSLLDAVMPGWPAAAEEPERRQLLEVEPSYVRFRHELARHAIRSSVPIAARRRLHAEILEALLAADADPADIVHHAEAAGAEDVVADYALVAARRAAALESNREAYSHYRRAADFVDRLPPPEQATVLEELAIGRVRSSAGSTTPSRRSSARSRSTASSATRRRSAAARASCRGCTGSPATASRQRGQALEAIAILEPLGESVELARAYSGLSQLAMLAEDVEQALAVGRTGARARDPARRRAARARTRSSTSAARRLQLDRRRHRDAPRGARASPTPPATGTRRRARSSTSATSSCAGCGRTRRCGTREQALAYAEAHEVHTRVVRRHDDRAGCGCAPASGTRPSG